MTGSMDIGTEVGHDIAHNPLSTRKRDTLMTLAERRCHKGLMEGRQNVLQRRPARRFVDSVLDIRMQERLRSAAPEEFDTRAERILDAASIDDIVTEPRTD